MISPGLMPDLIPRHDAGQGVADRGRSLHDTPPRRNRLAPGARAPTPGGVDRRSPESCVLGPGHEPHSERVPSSAKGDPENFAPERRKGQGGGSGCISGGEDVLLKFRELVQERPTTLRCLGSRLWTWSEREWEAGPPPADAPGSSFRRRALPREVRCGAPSGSSRKTEA